MNTPSLKAALLGRPARLATVGLMAVLLGACSSLLPKPTPAPSFYALNAGPAPARPAASAAGAASPRAPTLVVEAPQAAAGYDSARIVYTRQPHQLEAFAHSEWVDTPARMLWPMLVDTLSAGGAFRGVVGTLSAASTELRLSTEIVRLQQEFGAQGSSVRFTLRASLVDGVTRQLLATRDFEAVAEAATADAQGGVLAADRAVRTVLQALARFCADTSAAWLGAAAHRQPASSPLR